MSKERHLTVRGRYENVPAVVQFVVEAAKEAGFDEKGVFHCQMSVDEACTNIIEHAYGGQDKGDIEATVQIEPGVLTITLVDHGEPFDPTSVPEPSINTDDPSKIKTGGLGLHLMRKVMDEITFSFGDERNTLVMVKRQAVQSESEGRPPGNK